MRMRFSLQSLFPPIDGASIAVFRIGYGSIMMWEVWRYFSYNWIARYYTGHDYYFTYPGFRWVHPWPSLELMELHFWIIGILGAFIAFGLFYRIAATAMFFAFSYVFLLEQSRYLNHFYLIILIAFLMIFIPAHRTWSLDGWIKKHLPGWPFLLKTLPPMEKWGLWILRLQVGIVYFYGGIAKLNMDWLRGYPLRNWIHNSTDLPILGPYVHKPWMGIFLSYAGLLIDLLIVPLLLWKRTRWIGLIIALAFNLMNAELFSIGIFPWFMLVATLLFFEPDWPRRLWNFFAFSKSDHKRVGESRAPEAHSLTHSQKVTAALLAIYAAFQLLFPFRHLLYPGVVHWTEEGHMYAWHMKLRSKSAHVNFIVKDPETDQMWMIDPYDELVERQVDKMVSRPEMILQFAHYIRDQYRERGYDNVEVYADSWAALNGRDPQRFINPDVNLADVEWSMWHADWVLPLTTELK